MQVWELEEGSSVESGREARALYLQPRLAIIFLDLHTVRANTAA